MSVTLRTSVGELAITGSSYLRLSARGNWTAILEMASATAPAIGEPAVLSVLPEAKSGQPAPVPDLFSGTVRHARQVPGSDTLVCRIVGGAGRLFSSLPPADQVAGSTILPAGLILRKIADAAGERLAPGVEQALDAYLLPRWTRLGGMSARTAIDLLVYDLAAVTGLAFGWRMQADGAIWAGVETWPEATGSFVYTEQAADDGVMVYAPSGAPLRPGTTVLGERAIEVFYQFSSPAVRALVRRTVPGDPAPGTDPDTLAAMALYARSWTARVVAQNADGLVFHGAPTPVGGTLELTCDDPRVGDLHAVPFRGGVPGSLFLMPTIDGIETRVRLHFADGSPRGAYATAVDQNGTTGPSTTPQPFALVTDTIAGGVLTLIGAPPGLMLQWTPPGAGAPDPPGTGIGLGGMTIQGPGHAYALGVPGRS